MFLLIVPNFCYMMLLIYYYDQIIASNSEDRPESYFDYDRKFETCIRVSITAISLYLFSFEYRQLVSKGLSYFLDSWNLVQISLLVFNQFILLEHVYRWIDLSIEELVFCTVFATLPMWLAFYYTWRIFPQCAFYVKLLWETVKDLKQFIVFYLLIIFTFTSMMMIQDQYY